MFKGQWCELKIQQPPPVLQFSDYIVFIRKKYFCSVVETYIYYKIVQHFLKVIFCLSDQIKNGLNANFPAKV